MGAARRRVRERVVRCGIAVFSLSLWGLNWEDYIKEAARVLRLDGRSRIAASIRNWPAEKMALLLEALHRNGFELIGEVEQRLPFFYLDAIKTRPAQPVGQHPIAVVVAAEPMA